MTAVLRSPLAPICAVFALVLVAMYAVIAPIATGCVLLAVLFLLTAVGVCRLAYALETHPLDLTLSAPLSLVLALIAASLWAAARLAPLGREIARQYRQAVPRTTESAAISLARTVAMECPWHVGRDCSRFAARLWTRTDSARAAIASDVRENALGLGENLAAMCLLAMVFTAIAYLAIDRAICAAAHAVKEWTKAGSSARHVLAPMTAEEAARFTSVSITIGYTAPPITMPAGMTMRDCWDALITAMRNAQEIPARHFPSIAQVEVETPWDADITEDERASVLAYIAWSEKGTRPSPKCSTDDCYAEATEHVEGREPQCESCAQKADRMAFRTRREDRRMTTTDLSGRRR